MEGSLSVKGSEATCEFIRENIMACRSPLTKLRESRSAKEKKKMMRMEE